MKLCALAALAAFSTSSCVAFSFPYKMFSLMLVANRAGSWLTSLRLGEHDVSRSSAEGDHADVTSAACFDLQRTFSLILLAKHAGSRHQPAVKEK